MKEVVGMTGLIFDTVFDEKPFKTAQSGSNSDSGTLKSRVWRAAGGSVIWAARTINDIMFEHFKNIS